MNIVIRACATAVLTLTTLLPLWPSATSLSSTALAQNEASVCVNGYRTIHIVRSGDHSGGGVILRCRG
jgi:hypothetical protein